ncbi:hypothetical protein JHK84_037059 [Glycine max]|nr:hypothetical protein JHK84_037059 [Glycine max]
MTETYILSLPPLLYANMLCARFKDTPSIQLEYRTPLVEHSNLCSEILVQKYHIKAMKLSFTQGRWNYERWGGFDSISCNNAKPPGVELWAVFDVPLH